MANFGWAYVDCSTSGGGGGSDIAQAIEGATGSVLFLTGAGAASGSTHLVFHTASAGRPSHTLVLSGNMVITGTLSASVINYENISIIDATGSTFFGDTTDDVHSRTGSFELWWYSGGTTSYVSGCAITQRFMIVGG